MYGSQNKAHNYVDFLDMCIAGNYRSSADWSCCCDHRRFGACL